MTLTLKRCVALIGILLAIISFSRVAVLFLEALTEVRSERLQDSELLELCKQGAARGSMKMRAACLQAQADRASPVVLKAILRAVSTAFADFSESVSSPGKLMVVVLFVLSSLFLPIQGWIRALLPTEEVVEGLGHVVVLADRVSNKGFMRRGLSRGLLESKKHLTVPFDIASTSQDIEDSFMDIELLHEKRE
jgi:hypothetical protein